jgi:NAD(P)H-hydrate epimerase
VDIGHPPGEAGAPLFVTDTFTAAHLPPLHAADHKGERGRVVVIGGDVGMSGAARLAGRAAFAAGAGLVHVVAPPDTIAAIRVAEPDLQTLVHPTVGEVGDELRALLDHAHAVVIGPGLGRGDGKTAFVLACLQFATRAVIDADALVALHGRVPGLAALGATRALVLTPHAGEFRTLFPALASERDTDPWGAASHAADLCSSAVLLKGVPTVIARAGRPSLTIAAGNPGLATGGSGDVLSGMLGAVLARGGEPDVAAAVAAQALGRVADLAARRVTARAMRPMDVIAALPDLWREWDVMLRTGGAVEAPVLHRLSRPRLI